jgi:hypothetical protein
MVKGEATGLRVDKVRKQSEACFVIYELIQKKFRQNFGN